MDQCWVRKCKRPSGDGLWGAYEVGRDEHGVWLYTPEGSRYRGTSHDGTVGECFAGQPDAPGLHVMQLVPSGHAWWFGHWAIFRGHRTLSIDVCTPTVLAGDEWAYVDLELDLYKSSDGTVGAFDEDEFDEAVARGLISEEEQRASLDTAGKLDARLHVDDPVFDGLAWARLEAATALQLPPIADIV
jgi:hypothetical protein